MEFCISCQSQLNRSDLHYSCGRNHHCLCLECFHIYVDHCCSQASLDSTIPLRCPIPECKAFTEPHILAPLLYQCDIMRGNQHSPNSLQKKYEKAEITTALSMVNERLISCDKCGDYVVLYEPLSPEHWIQLEQTKLMSIEEVKAKCDNRLKSILKEMDNNSRKLINDLNDKVKNLERELNILAEEIISKVAEEKIENDKKEAIDNLSKFKPLTMKDKVKLYNLRSINPSQVTSKQKEELLELETKLGMSKVLEKSWDSELSSYRIFLRDTQKEQIKQTHGGTICSALKDMQSSLQKVEDDLSKRREELQTFETEKLTEIVSKLRQCNDSKVISKIKQEYLVKVLKEKPVESEKEKITLSESTKFITCARPDCSGGFCIACEKSVSKLEISSHICKLDAVAVLYFQVIDTLARASTRTCPNCNYIGQKDLACTHITCTKCGSRWCYHCQILEKDLPGGFSAHNKWSLKSSDGEEEKTCPMYLQYKYGDIDKGATMDGSPELALSKYHLQLQRKAISDLQAISPPEVWQHMTQMYFPEGILPSDLDSKVPIPQKQEEEKDELEEKEPLLVEEVLPLPVQREPRFFNRHHRHRRFS